MNAILRQISESKTWVSTTWASTTRTLEPLLPTSLQPWMSSHLLTLIILVATGSLLRRVWNTVYNLYLHPLAKFPGPREAALSRNWVYKNSLDGRIEPILEKIHERYSMSLAPCSTNGSLLTVVADSLAIRISPNELHISDVALYKTLYSQNDPWTKDGDFYAAFGTPHSVFVETDHGLHKKRRKLLNPFFSRAGILGVQGLVSEKVRTLSARLRKSPPGLKVNLYNAFRCLTVDIISDYASGKCLDQVKTSDDSFLGSYLEAFDAMGDIIWDLCYRPVMRRFIALTPAPIAKRVSKEAGSFFRLLEANTAALHAYRAKPDVGRPVVYSALDGCTEVEAVAEATDILAAGSDTTAYSLAVGLWHIMDNQQIKEELAEALAKNMPDLEEIPSLPTLEKIPILTAIVKEIVRITIPVPGRLPRIVPDHASLFVEGKRVPAGTIVGISAYTMHHSKELWGPNASRFDPHRWLTGDSAAMDQNMVAFSKGRRSCIGQSLAYGEIYVVLAYLIRNFDFELATNSATPDASDRFTSMVRKPGILAYVKPREK